jgi:hypothetical protein
MRPCIICEQDIFHRHTNARKTCEGTCALEYRRAKDRIQYSKTGRTYYQRSDNDRKENDPEYVEKRRKAAKEFRERNPEYHRTSMNPIYNSKWAEKRPQIADRIEKILRGCDHARAERVCQLILNSSESDLRRFSRSYVGDEILASYLG